MKGCKEDEVVGEDTDKIRMKVEKSDNSIKFNALGKPLTLYNTTYFKII